MFPYSESRKNETLKMFGRVEITQQQHSSLAAYLQQ